MMTLLSVLAAVKVRILSCVLPLLFFLRTIFSVKVTDIHFLTFICGQSLNPEPTHAVPSPKKNSFWPLLHMDHSKAWFMKIRRSIGCKNPLTAAQVTLFVVRMWLKHHLLGLKILYRGRLGHGPVFLERLCPRKKDSTIFSKIQTLKRLIRIRVKMS